MKDKHFDRRLVNGAAVIALVTMTSCIGFQNALRGGNAELKSSLDSSQVTILFSNMDDFPVSGTCARGDGDVLIVDDGQVVDVQTPCDDNTFSASVDFTDVPDGDVDLTISQESGGESVTVTLTRDADTCMNGQSGTFATASSGGTGDEHMICTAAQLANVAAESNDSFILRDDIDLGGGSIANLGAIATGEVFDGNSRTISNGTFAANGLFTNVSGTIQNLTLDNVHIDDPGTVTALLGNLGDVGIADNITVTNSSVRGQASGAFSGMGGLFAGSGTTSSTVRNSDIDIDVTNIGLGQTGGVIGRTNSGTLVEDVIVRGTVTTIDSGNGGLIFGDADNTTVNRVTVYGSVTATNDSGSAKFGVGGAVGFSGNSDYTDVIVYANVTSSGGADIISKIGGFQGGNTGNNTFTRCGVVGNVAGSGDNVGGFLGQGTGTDVLNEVFARGDVSGRDSVGGLLGYADATVNDGYFVGSVDGRDGVGGLVGGDAGTDTTRVFVSASINASLAGDDAAHSGGTTSNGFYNSDVSGVGTSGGASAVTSVQLATQSTFTGFDFSSKWTMGSSYPVFQWE
jgi:hypothetical protein